MAMVAMALALAPMLPGGKSGHIGNILLMAQWDPVYTNSCVGRVHSVSASWDLGYPFPVPYPWSGLG